MSALPAIAVLAILILVHELGHFMAARLQGIHVNRFSIGFGPVLWKYQGKQTEYALRAIPLGGYVGFPDDDCLFPDTVLAQVAARFADPALGVLTGPAASPEGGLGSGRWRAEAGAITLDNVWTSVIEFNLFLRRDLALRLGGFDETLGPGTPFGSAEGNDVCARAIKAGAKAVYDPALRIIHPDKRLTEVAVARAGLYGAGLGRVLRRHARPGVTLPFIIRPIGGMALSALRLRRLEFSYYAATLRGRLKGLMAAP